MTSEVDDLVHHEVHDAKEKQTIDRVHSLDIDVQPMASKSATQMSIQHVADLAHPWDHPTGCVRLLYKLTCVHPSIHFARETNYILVQCIS